MRYKRLLRSKIQGFLSGSPDVTLTLLAERLGIEPGTFSRYLGGSPAHFPDELLRRLCAEIGLNNDELARILTCRQQDRAAAHPPRTVAHGPFSGPGGGAGGSAGNG